MLIHLSPVRAAAPITASVAGDVLTLDGEALDFGPMAEGDRLPAEATGSPHIVGHVERTGGEIVVKLTLPHGADAPEATRFPEPIQAGDGPVALPPYDGGA